MSTGVSRASHGATNDKVFELLAPRLVGPLKIMDMGCGRGFFIKAMAERYRAAGWPVAESLLGIDVDLSGYAAQEVPSAQVDINRPLPYGDAGFDVVVAIEVFEHTRAPYLLMEEVLRILKPGGILIMSVPNVMHMASRLTYLLTGHYAMYPTPSTKLANAGRLCGHIQPLPVQYWHYGLRFAGFSGIACMTDRSKRGATWLAALLSPFTSLGSIGYRRRLARYDAALAEEVKDVVPLANSLAALTGRSLIFKAEKPA